MPSLEPYLGAIGSSYSGVVGSPYLDGAFGAIYWCHRWFHINASVVEPYLDFVGRVILCCRQWSYMSFLPMEPYLGVVVSS